MPELEVEVMLKDHAHLFVVDIESVLEAPRIGEPFTCPKCQHEGTISHVGTPGRKERRELPPVDDSQTSLFKG